MQPDTPPTLQTSISIVGRVNNYKLRPTDPNKALLPLFEAVVNSIHSIEETGRKDGEIEIYVERLTQGSLLPEHTGLEPIENFVIVDNGGGFNDEHFTAFLTSDTDYKLEKGGKGIGRFAWLKAFSSIEIESDYIHKGSTYKRSFRFKKSENPISNHENNQISENLQQELKTTIKLANYNLKFREKCPKTISAIANRIVEHCLPTFLQDFPPHIKIIDTSRSDFIDLNELIGGTKMTSCVEKFNCAHHTFKVTHLRIYSASEDIDHRIHLLGQDREVDRENLSKSIPFLKAKNRIQDKEDRGFIYSAYVSSDYLDESLNSERTGFDIPTLSSSVDLQDGIISRENIITQALRKAEAYLDTFIQEMADDNLKRIEDYICREKPIYRPLLKYREHNIKRLSPGLSSSQLDIELYKLYAALELEVKEKSKDLLNASKPQNRRQLSERKKVYRNFLEESNSIGQSKLAAYVIHRKSVLDLLENSLFVSQDGKYSKEEIIHDIIFPQHQDSNEVAYEQQNLWIIDEKLSFHRYLASDISLSKYEGIDIESSKRPDVTVFNNPEAEKIDNLNIYDRKFAFVPDGRTLSSVIILEFKRPQRDNYTDNPIDQVTEYVDLIQSGKANDRNGRPIIIKDNTPFYVYIICDLSPKIRKIASARGFTPSPDNDGYFWYNQNMWTYFEIISYQKLVEDAKARNSVLFEKLGIRDS